MIEVKELNWKYYNKEVLKNINIKFEMGKIYSIIGPNGSGKTTLLKNLLKILKPSENSVFIDGTDILEIKEKEISQKVSYVPQIVNNDISLTVYDAVIMGRSPFIKRFAVESESDKLIAENAMQITNTLEYKNRRLNELSGGEHQRVIIARALTQSPKIIFLDEPLSNLDLHHQIEIMDLLRYLNKEKGLTVILVVHDLNIALQYSDKVILMNNGKLVDFGDSEDVISGKKIKDVYKMDFTIIKINEEGRPYLIPKTNQFSFFEKQKNDIN